MDVTALLRCPGRRLLRAAFFVLAMFLAAASTARAANSRLSPSELLVRALGNGDISYMATRTSIFWADNGQTRALVARVYKNGDRTRYEYPARGNRPACVVIETADTLYYICPDGARTRVTTAHREKDPEVEGVRVKLAMQNYIWKYDASSTDRRRVVAGWRPNAHHPSQRFWIATSPMVVVRSERYGPNGALRSSWSLDNLHVVGVLPPSLFAPPHGPDLELRDAVMPEQVRLDQVRERVGFKPVLLPQNKIPEGYKLVDVCVERINGETAALYSVVQHNETRQAVRFVYSDGLDSLSLLEAPRRGQQVKIKSANAQDVQILDTTAQVFTTAEANLVNWQDQRRLYTIIGSLPSARLVDLSRAIIASTAPAVRKVRVIAAPVTTTVIAPVTGEPHHRTLGEAIARGWSRFLRFFGL